MVRDVKKVALCQRLSQEVDELVFWKHLDRALAGVGDFDMFVPASRLDDAARSVARVITQSYLDVEAVVCCNHIPSARLLFAVRPSVYPLLEEYDLGTIQTRFGVPWLEVTRILPFAVLNEDGVRVLRRGALAVVLIMLYCVNRTGSMRLKPDDRAEVVRGWLEEREIVCATVSTMPEQLQAPLWSVLVGLSSDGCGWNHRAARQLWWTCARVAFSHHTELGVTHSIRFLRDASPRSCPLRTIVHEHKRVSPEPDRVAFLQRMRSNEQVLFEAGGAIA